MCVHISIPCEHMMFVIRGIVNKNFAIIKTPRADAIFYVCKIIILVKKTPEQIRIISCQRSISQLLDKKKYFTLLYKVKCRMAKKRLIVLVHIYGIS